MGQSPIEQIFTAVSPDAIPVEKLSCQFYSVRGTETKNFPVFYSFLSIQMLPYIIFLCKFVQLVDRYFSLLLGGGPSIYQHSTH